MLYNYVIGGRMKNNFIILDFGKVFIEWENGDRVFYKETIDELVRLSHEELEIVNKIFDISKYNEYYSMRIESILNNNDNIDNKEFVINFLLFLENIIPNDSKINFYRNLESLKVKLNLDVNLDEVKENNNSVMKAGNYNVKKNELFIEQSYLKRLWDIAQSSNNPIDFFWNELNLDILHEFCHMASSRYDLETGIAYCGFDKYPYTNPSDGNRGLTEGMTEVIAMAGITNTIEIASGYYIEVSFINQIMLIVGKDVMLKSYFDNEGTTLIEKELDKYKSGLLSSKILFRRIEDNFYLNSFDGRQGVLAGVQAELIDFYENKMLYSIRNGLMSYEEVNESLTMYENMLITPDKITLMRKNPDNYIGLEESVKMFYVARDRINNELMLLNRNGISK